jgi:diaminopimelate epimerase
VTAVRPIDFIKLQSCGKDYILIDAMRQSLPADGSEWVSRICRRRLGVGGYGVILVAARRERSLEAHIMERDGADSVFCADALRCLGRYGYDAGLLESENAELRVGGRGYSVDMIDSSNVMIGLGTPTDPQTGVELRENPSRDFTMTVEGDEMAYTCTPLRLGGNHATLFVPHYDMELERVAAIAGAHELLGGRARSEFVRVYSADGLFVRSVSEWGREEPSSGDSSAAAVVSSVLNGLTGREVMARNRGGIVYVHWEEATGGVYVTAPVSYLFTGTYDAGDG